MIKRDNAIEISNGRQQPVLPPKAQRTYNSPFFHEMKHRLCAKHPNSTTSTFAHAHTCFQRKNGKSRYIRPSIKYDIEYV